MLLKYLKLFPFLPQCAFCDAPKEVFLTNDEDKDIRLLCDQLKEVEIRLKFLQGDYCDVDEWDSDAETKKDKAVAREAKNPKRSPLTLLSSCIVFDQLIDFFPSMNSHLAADAHVVHNRDFENAVIKIQTNKEDKLTSAEKRAVKVFLLAPSAEEEADEEAEEDFTEMIARLEEEAIWRLRRSRISFTVPHFSY